MGRRDWNETRIIFCSERAGRYQMIVGDNSKRCNEGDHHAAGLYSSMPKHAEVAKQGLGGTRDYLME